MTHLPQLVRLLSDLRLATLALSILVEVLTERSPAAVVLMLLAVTLSYLPLRRWETVSRLAARTPLVQLLDVVTATALLLVVSTTQLMLVYALATVVLGGLVFGRAGAMLSSGLMTANMLTAAVVSELAGFGSVTSTMTLVVYALLYALAGLGSFRLRQLLADIDDTHALATAESRRAAHAEERARLSREMHDGVSKSLHGISMLAGSLRRQLDAGRADQAARLATQLGEAAQAAAKDSRRLLSELRSDQPSESLAAAYTRLVEDWAQVNGTPLGDVRVDAGVELGVGARYEALCVVGEALENVARHAGASRVDASLRQEGGWVEFEIVDDGVGLAAPPDSRRLGRDGHYGVLGMHERATRVGGRLELVPGTPSGTVVRLLVPAALAAGPSGTAADRGARHREVRA